MSDAFSVRKNPSIILYVWFVFLTDQLQIFGVEMESTLLTFNEENIVRMTAITHVNFFTKVCRIC